ncbi:MAG: RNA polymerase sigma-70 factor, partial [Muribaculaceae bacterium]|nr:RNA polymerase sigma-70 factor [Muribaculaceae bacterium]
MEESFNILFRGLFRKYYSDLVFYATRLVGDQEAEDVVQEAFAELWNRKEAVTGEHAKAFLYRTVYTRGLNILKHRAVCAGYTAAAKSIDEQRVRHYCPDDNNDVITRIESMELRKEIDDAIEELSPRCREVFRMSYLHDLSNKDIAEKLGVSLRTVEAQMYKALRSLRRRLKHALPLILYCFSWLT